MVKRVLKIFALILVFVLISMQFISIDRTNPPVDESIDFLSNYTLSSSTSSLLKKACYDCHSYETVYPWYSHVAPVSFFLEDHIKHGRGELNFSEFDSYSLKKKDHKLEEVIEALEEGWMPLNNYVWLHSEADLTLEQRRAMAKEFEEIRLTLKR